MARYLSIKTPVRCACPVSRFARPVPWATTPTTRNCGFRKTPACNADLCSNICPEKAITLQPQLDLTDAAFTQKVVHEEEPFACVDCGVLFGVKSTVERITEKLAGNHAMFSRPETIRMIQMCDNCRVQAQYHSDENPFRQQRTPARAHHRGLPQQTQGSLKLQGGSEIGGFDARHVGEDRIQIVQCHGDRYNGRGRRRVERVCDPVYLRESCRAA